MRWDDGIRSLAAAGATRFLEAGPGDVLTKLMKRIDPALTGDRGGLARGRGAAVSVA